MTKPGDLIELGPHLLLCGDSTDPQDVRKVMAGRRAILMATDPPYLVDYDGTNHPGKKSQPIRQLKRKNKDWSATYGVTWDEAAANPEHVKELQSVLADDRVRFHIKRVAFHSLSATADPTQGEWMVLRELEAAQPKWVGHVDRVVSDHAGWFDRLDAAGFLDSGLSSGEKQKEERIVWLCAMPEILKYHSARVAALLRQHRRGDDAWRHYLQYVCRTGDVFHSRELFELFLSLIRDGTLDGTRPGFAVNDNWWSTLYSMSDEAPAMAAEAIAAWLDWRLEAWAQTHPAPTSGDQQQECGDGEDEGDNIEDSEPAMYLLQHLGEDGDDHGVIANAAEATLGFVEELLPRVAAFVAKHAKPCRGRLDIDPLWSFRAYGDDEHQVHDSLFKSLPVRLRHWLALHRIT